VYPQGYLSSGDSYTKHTNPILDDWPEKPFENDYEKIVDEIIQWSETMEQSFFRICSLLSHCNKNRMVFSPNKFMFAKETVEFAGFEITMEGIRPTDKYIEAIRNFPTPTNISEVRSWFGLINQVYYSFVKTGHMAPLRHLLSQSQPFMWDETMETAFRLSKERIIELIVEGVASFDVNLVTCLSPDYSKQGIGDQSLADVENPRLARIKEKTLWWQFTIVHTTGKPQLAADALSQRKTKLPSTIYQLRIHEPDDEVANDLKNRFEHHFPEPDTSDFTEEETAAAYSILSSEEILVITWERLYEVANEDRLLVKLKEVVLRGFPQSSYDVDEELKQFHKFKHDLHEAEEVVCYKDRIIIPAKLRPQVLETIHAAHQGVSGMISRVEDTVFWPGICTDIIKTRGGCLTCIRDTPSQPAGTPVTPPMPSSLSNLWWGTTSHWPGSTT
jgi:hypothetical protein